MTKGTILVVDDEKVIREVISRILQSKGYTVSQASDGLKAKEEIERLDDKCRGIVSDFNMEGKEHFFEYVRQCKSELPFLIMTGNPGQAKDYGFSVIMKKPFNSDTLLNNVYTHFGQP